MKRNRTQAAGVVGRLGECIRPNAGEPYIAKKDVITVTIW